MADLASNDELRFWDLEDMLNELHDFIRILNDRVRDTNLNTDEAERVRVTMREIDECRRFLQDRYIELDEILEEDEPAAKLVPKLPSRFKNA